MGRFQITQAYTSEHDGLDLVGLDSKQIHSTVNGTVIHAGWENPSNHSQGFGLYVCIRVGNQDYYYGHMSQIYVSVGQTVKITDIIGLEGSTGYSTGSHCHYCCRVSGARTPLDINSISGIPNVVGGIYDDGGSGGTIPSGGGISGGAPNGGILSDAFQLSYLNGGSWTNFTNQAMSYMDGIKIQATRVRPYYLTYRTWNQGRDDFYPYVTSSENDYAGSNGKPVQLLQIQAFDHNGTKLTTGVVVMYRAYVEGRWLPWVSNANPDWMRSVQAKYNLDGILDTSSYYAGIDGKNISGIEVRIFEENNTNIPTPEPSGKSKIIDAPFISQKPSYPTGCESVATVMALQYAGVNISVDKFIDNYLYRTGMIFDPNESFGGNPRGNGYGCYSPVIKKALDKCFAAEGLSTYSATELKNISLQQLCTDYIDKDIPVIMWATIDMKPWYNGDHWYYNGKKIQWIAPEHCLLLIGYDDQNYIFNDPWRNKQTYYRKSAVEAAYAGLFKQAVVITKKQI